MPKQQASYRLLPEHKAWLEVTAEQERRRQTDILEFLIEYAMEQAGVCPKFAEKFPVVGAIRDAAPAPRRRRRSAANSDAS